MRELENAIEYAFIKAKTKSILPEDLPLEIRLSFVKVQGRRSGNLVNGKLDEKEALCQTLAQTGWRISKAARLMGVHRTTVWRRIKQYGIRQA